MACHTAVVEARSRTALCHPVAPLPLKKQTPTNCRLYRDSTQYVNGQHVRDLSKLNRDMRQVLLITADPAAYSLQVCRLEEERMGSGGVGGWVGGCVDVWGVGWPLLGIAARLAGAARCSEPQRPPIHTHTLTRSPRTQSS